jgi:hypothetical protein
MAKAQAKKATKLPKLPDGSVFKPEGAKIGMTDSVAVAKPAEAKGISKPGELYRDRDAMFNHLFDAKMGITTKKGTTLQEHGPEVAKSMTKLERLEEKDPAAFRKELNKWMRGNNVVKSAR